MSDKKLSIIRELQNLKAIILGMNRKVVVIFLSVAVLQTISWYITSRRFFRVNIFPSYQYEPDIYLIEYLFGIPLGPAPFCLAEGNVNGDIEEKINIGDVTYLVEYLFGSPLGPAPQPCPTY